MICEEAVNTMITISTNNRELIMPSNKKTNENIEKKKMRKSLNIETTESGEVERDRIIGSNSRGIKNNNLANSINRGKIIHLSLMSKKYSIPNKPFQIYSRISQ